MAKLFKTKFFWAMVLVLCGPLLLVYASQPGGGVVPLKIGEHTVEVELATNTLEHARGLMFRESMPDNHGMLFVFSDDVVRSFWMKNTFIPLSIAYIDRDKRIINLHDMAPNNDKKSYKSTAPARYALEVNMGWFAARGIKAGDQVQFELPEADAK